MTKILSFEALPPRPVSIGGVVIDKLYFKDASGKQFCSVERRIMCVRTPTTALRRTRDVRLESVGASRAPPARRTWGGPFFLRVRRLLLQCDHDVLRHLRRRQLRRQGRPRDVRSDAHVQVLLCAAACRTFPAGPLVEPQLLRGRRNEAAP